MERDDFFERHSKKKKNKELDKIVRQIKLENTKYSILLGRNPSEEQASKFFKSVTERLRKEANNFIRLGYSEDEALKRILPKAYGIVKLASKYKLGKSHYDVQLIGGILLNDGYVSEMATGEGKTITAALPTYLNALLGKGAHVITPNAYLARRDFEEMKQVYELLGLSCGIVEEIKPSENKEKVKRLALDIYRSKLVGYSRVGKSTAQITAETRAMELAARREASAQIKKEDITRRQSQYACDITYGSSNAFAFDYLFDGLETKVENMRNRNAQPNFLVIDEADAVLFDDAVTPFTLSGTQEDSVVAITEDEKTAREKNVAAAAQAMLLITEENKRLKKYFKAKTDRRFNTDGLIYNMDNPSLYDSLVAGKVVDEDKYASTQAIYYCKKTKQFHITPVGEACFFMAFKKDEINPIINAHKDELLGLVYKGQPLLTKDLDYTLDDAGNLTLAPRAFSYIANSNIIPELTQMFDEFMLTDYQDAFEDINNAVTAWLVLENDVDYKYSVPKDSIDPEHERSISLIMNGRTAEGRVYSNGLQQAVESKEKIKSLGTGLVIKDTKMKDTLASIPAASFFGRYSKFSGMTGTSAVQAFRELYGLETFEVPRNKPRQVTDHGDRLYKTAEDKNKAILEEVIASHAKGQPILLTTTSVEESIKLHEFLTRELAARGITVSIPVLNANVDKLKEEADIIAHAGEKGAITISTEMAGRGTDIKLGGIAPPTLEEEIEIEKTRRLLATRANLEAKGIRITGRHIKAINEMHEKYKDEIIEKARAVHERKMLQKAMEERTVLAAGGLKVIGSGHFMYRRVDNQVKGRCGRQGNVGETVFFNDLEDLQRIGVPPKEMSKLARMLESGPIIEPTTARRTPLSDIIYEAQEKNESRTKDGIEHSQKIEKTVANCRNRLRIITEGVKRENHYEEEVEFMIEKVVADIVATSSGKVDNPKDLRGKMKLSRIKLDTEQLRDLSDEFLGIELSETDLEAFTTVGELVEFLEDGAKTKLEAELTAGGEEFLSSTKNLVDERLKRTWFAFEDVLERIKLQRSMVGLIPGNNPPEDIEPFILDGFAHCYESMTAQIVRQVLNPNYLEKHPEDHFGLSQFIINTDVTTTRVSNKEGKEREEESARIISQEVEEARVERETERNRITSVNVPYFVSVVKERLKITKDRRVGRTPEETHTR